MKLLERVERLMKQRDEDDDGYSSDNESFHHKPLLSKAESLDKSSEDFSRWLKCITSCLKSRYIPEHEDDKDDV